MAITIYFLVKPLNNYLHITTEREQTEKKPYTKKEIIWGAKKFLYRDEIGIVKKIFHFFGVHQYHFRRR